MVNHIVLSSTDADEAKATFQTWLKDRFTLLVVLGTDQMAQLALDKADKMINSGSANYESVRAIYAQAAGFIVPILMGLKVNPEIPPIDWANIGKYAILSISNKYNNIGKIYSKTDFTGNEEGKINLLVLKAQAFDIAM